MRRAAVTGAVVGIGIGLLALAVTFAVAVRCLPYQVSQPPQPWPGICSDPAYSILMLLAFPVSLLTNDLAAAPRYAPLTLGSYAMIGMLIALARNRRAPSDPGE